MRYLRGVKYSSEPINSYMHILLFISSRSHPFYRLPRLLAYSQSVVYASRRRKHRFWPLAQYLRSKFLRKRESDNQRRRQRTWHDVFQFERCPVKGVLGIWQQVWFARRPVYRHFRRRQNNRVSHKSEHQRIWIDEVRHLFRDKFCKQTEVFFRHFT